MKRFFSLFLAFVLCFSLIPLQQVGAISTVSLTYYDEISATYGEETTVNVVNLTLDGAPLSGSMPAINTDGRTLVPVRLVAEALGAEVIWVNSTRQVVLLKGTDTIVLTLGSAQAVYNGQIVTLPDEVPASIVGYNDTGNTMVPLRFVSEQLGATVEWDNDSYTAVITSPLSDTVVPEPEVTPEPEVEVTPTPTPTPESSDTPGFVTGVTADSTTVYIFTDHTPEYYIMDLGDRVTVDVMNAYAPAVSGSVSINNEIISGVRYSQYDDKTYYDVDHSVRIVLDLNEGYSLSDLSIDSFSGGIWVSTEAIQDEEEQQEQEEVNTTLSTPTTPSAFTIVLDPGHGGDDTGASYEGIDEKDINLSVSYKLEAILKNLGYQVVMTRYDDSTVGLYDRADIANAVEADVYVSLHANATTVSDTFEGIYTYYHPDSTRGATFAQMIQTPICALTGAIDRGIKDNDYVVLRETVMPAVLVEMGFMTAPTELIRLIDDEYQDLLATGIAEGIIQYLNSLI